MNIEQTAVILKLLGDKTRLTMIKVMSESEVCVCELVSLFDMSQPAISQHLKKLKDVGLVNEMRKGQWVFYSLNEKNEAYSLVQSILEKIPNQQNKLLDLETKGLRIICN
jgi:ArsR family transcriptional regulator, arsenate/arsenite/antimonite-responsive transcriptional repressor